MFRSTSGSLGMPSTRSAMMLRWIWSVPPPIEVKYALRVRKFGVVRARVAASLQQARGGQDGRLHPGASRAGSGTWPACRATGCGDDVPCSRSALARSEFSALSVRSAVGPGDVLADGRVAQHPGLRRASATRSTSGLDRAAVGRGRPRRRGPPRPSPTARRPGPSAAPASPRSAAPSRFVGRDDRVGEEHLVELALAGDLPQRAHLDARLLHRQEEEADPAVLRARPSRCGRPACRSRRSRRPTSTPSGR